MSQEDLVNAYIDGQVSRRTFVRRLVAAGVSLGAAMSYAHLLAAEKASAGTAESQRRFDFYNHYECSDNGDFYGADLTATIHAQSKASVVSSQKVKVQFTTTEAALVTLVIKVKDDGRFKRIGARVVETSGSATVNKNVQISGRGKRIIAGKKKPRLKLIVRAEDRCHNKTSARTNETLS